MHTEGEGMKLSGGKDLQLQTLAIGAGSVHVVLGRFSESRKGLITALAHRHMVVVARGQ
jgi:hypothetical protein